MPTLPLSTTANYPSRGVAGRLVSRGLLDVHGVPVTVRVAKAIIDVTFALTICILGSWLFALVALAIYLDSGGPVLYRQKRAAALRRRDAHGRCIFESFDMLKFRTMKVDAEKA